MKKTSLSDKFDFYKDDIIPTLRFILFILACVFIAVFGKSLLNKWFDRELTQETYGVVTKIEEKKIDPKKNYYDGKNNTEGYFVEFYYFAKHQKIKVKTYVRRGTLTLLQNGRIRNTKAGDTLTVKYHPQDREAAKLIVEKFTK